MTKIVLDQALAERLRAVVEAGALCDPAGNILGYYLPETAKRPDVHPSTERTAGRQPASEDYDRVWNQIDPQQLEAARKEPGGVTTQELLEFLRRQ